MENIFANKNRSTYNYGYIIPLYAIPYDKREQALIDFSEGSKGLYRCLKTMWSMGLNTIGCRIGIPEMFNEGYITMEEGIDLFRYLSSNILDDDMVRLWIINDKDQSNSKQVLIFAGSQERKEEILLHLVEDLLTGIKDNAKEVNNKIGKPFATSYLIDKKEYELRRKLGLPEEIIAEDLFDYRKLLLENDQKER